MTNDNTEYAEKEMIENIIHSTNNALEALIQLEKSLNLGGFKEGKEAYELMCKTLVGQRLWSAEKKCPPVENNFKRLGSISRRIVSILDPYIQSLRKLEQFIDQEEDFPCSVRDTKKESDLSADCRKVLNVIKDSSNIVSLSKIRSIMGWDKKKTNDITDMLCKKDLIAIKKQNGRHIVYGKENKYK